MEYMDWTKLTQILLCNTDVLKDPLTILAQLCLLCQNLRSHLRQQSQLSISAFYQPSLHKFHCLAAAICFFCEATLSEKSTCKHPTIIPNHNFQPTSKIMLLVHHVNDKSSSLSEDKCMGVFRPGLYLVFKEGAAPPPARNLKIKQTTKPVILHPITCKIT